MAFAGFIQTDSHPVVAVSWNDAVALCKCCQAKQVEKSGLLTETEWEYAARAGAKLKYPWGNIFDGSKLNFADQNTNLSWSDKNINDGYARTAPVGSLTTNELGLFDMAGNVWEWCQDWYGSYTTGVQTNPTGPDLVNIILFGAVPTTVTARAIV